MWLIKKFVSNNFSALIGSRVGIGFQRQQLITVFAQRGTKKSQLGWRRLQRRRWLWLSLLPTASDTHSINKYCITACRNLRLCQMCECACAVCACLVLICVYVFSVCVCMCCVCVCLLCVRAELLIKYLRCLFAKWIILAFYFASTMCAPCLSCLPLSVSLSPSLSFFATLLFCVCWRGRRWQLLLFQRLAFYGFLSTVFLAGANLLAHLPSTWAPY